MFLCVMCEMGVRGRRGGEFRGEVERMREWGNFGCWLVGWELSESEGMECNGDFMGRCWRVDASI